MIPVNPHTMRRWFGKVSIGEEQDACWWWTGATKPAGYGNMRHDGKYFTAHRFSYYAFNGPIGDGQVVRHTCDNPSCVNPDHLLVGTVKENSADSVQRGRARGGVRGVRNNRSKLTPESVRIIRLRLDAGEKQKDIAESFGVTQTCISSIHQNKTWRHVA